MIYLVRLAVDLIGLVLFSFETNETLVTVSFRKIRSRSIYLLGDSVTCNACNVSIRDLCSDYVQVEAYVR